MGVRKGKLEKIKNHLPHKCFLMFNHYFLHLFYHIMFHFYNIQICFYKIEYYPCLFYSNHAFSQFYRFFRFSSYICLSKIITKSFYLKLIFWSLHKILFFLKKIKFCTKNCIVQLFFLKIRRKCMWGRKISKV